MQGRSLVAGRTVQANLNCYWMMNSSYSTVFGLGASSTVRRQMLHLRPSQLSGSSAAAMRIFAFVSETPKARMMSTWRHAPRQISWAVNIRSERRSFSKCRNCGTVPQK
jgi:hypothetical protein